jgi:hypothetical protein
VNKVILAGCIAVVAFGTGTARAADSKEEPVGLILSAPGAKVTRASTETPLAARSGDILFSGDALKAIGNRRKHLTMAVKFSSTRNS